MEESARGSACASAACRETQSPALVPAAVGCLEWGLREVQPLGRLPALPPPTPAFGLAPRRRRLLPMAETLRSWGLGSLF